MSNESSTGMNLLRCVAIFLIILGHTSARLLGDFTDAWNAANIYDSFSRCSVPVFFMISGFFLVGKEENPKIFYKKRFIKIIPPFIIASIFYAIYKGLTLKSFPLLFIRGEVFFSLWFVYALIGIYLILPIVRYIIKKISTRIMHIVLGVWCIVFIFYNFINNYTNMAVPFFEAWSIYFTLGYLGYVLLGYALKTVTIQKYSLLFIIYVISSLMICIFTCVYSHSLNKLNEIFYDFLSPFVLFQSVSLFLLFKNIRIDCKIVQTVSACSYWMYLNHMFVLYFFYYILKINAQSYSLLTIPLLAIAGFIASFILSYWLWKGEQAVWEKIRRVPYPSLG